MPRVTPFLWFDDRLEVAVLVRSTRLGREQIYALEPRRFETARGCLERISRDWDVALGRLQALVEDGGACNLAPAPAPRRRALPAALTRSRRPASVALLPWALLRTNAR